MTLEEIRRDFKRMSLRLPSYIEQSNEQDYWIYSRMRAIMKNILLLLKPYILSEHDLSLILDGTNIIADEMFKYLNVMKDDRYILISGDIIFFTETLYDTLLENEEYESLDNLKRFNENFHKV